MPKTETVPAIIPAEIKAVDIYHKGGLDPLLKEIREQAMSYVPDLSTGVSRKEIASIAYKVAQSKTLIDTAGKELVADLKKKVKAVDDLRKHARDTLDDLKVEVRKPLTEWEEVEEKRKGKIRARIAEITALAQTHKEDGKPLSAAALKRNLNSLREYEVDESYEDLQGEAHVALSKAAVDLVGAIEQAQLRENKDAEIAAEIKAENDRKEAEEKARIEAVHAAAKASAEKAAAEKAEKEKAEAAAAEAAKRNDAANRAKVHNAIIKALKKQPGLKKVSDDDLGLLVSAIAGLEIPHLSISY